MNVRVWVPAARPHEDDAPLLRHELPAQRHGASLGKGHPPPVQSQSPRLLAQVLLPFSNVNNLPLGQNLPLGSPLPGWPGLPGLSSLPNLPLSAAIPGASFLKALKDEAALDDVKASLPR